jgi:O-acetylhomoserine (thiol)-lyase
MGKYMSTLKERDLKFETLQLHVGQEEPDPVTDARAVPIYQTSSYVFRNSQHAADRFGLRDAGNIYGRLTNPTEDIFEQRIAALEGGVAALAVGSGAAAVTYTIENLAQAGGHIVSAKNIYGGTYNLLAHTLVDFGVTTTFVDPFNLEEVEGAIKDNTKAVYIETLGNPNSEVVDIEALAEIAHKHKIPLVIDNTFATPYLVRPIEYGADIVVHSATKFIGGHGTTIGGVIVDSGKFDWAASGKFPQLTEPNPSYHGVSFAAAAGPAAFVTRIRAILLRDTGATLSPIHAFIFLQGLETLSLRVERHVENALKVVEFLEKQPLVEKVNHPSVSEDPEQQRLYKKYFPNGGGSIFTFEIKGDDKKAQEFIDHLQLFSLLANVADVKSLVIHPASTTHAELNEQEQAEQGIKPNTIRLSIGTENIDDILYDLQEAFDAVK